MENIGLVGIAEAILVLRLDIWSVVSFYNVKNHNSTTMNLDLQLLTWCSEFFLVLLVNCIHIVVGKLSSGNESFKTYRYYIHICM